MELHSVSTHRTPDPDPPFKAHRKPQFKIFKFAKDVPPLPEPQNEIDFYANWHYRERVAGMPGVPDVPFLTAWNLSEGNCYWAAIAMLVYGDYRYWPIVKGQHYVWFRDIIANQDHPRNTLYNLLNDDGSMDMMDRLEHASEWASTSTMQVTADLYDLFLVMFISHGQNSVIYTRGCRNASHRFIQLINGDHYEPMRPACDLSSEFHFPESTGESRTQNDDNASPLGESGPRNVPVQRSDIPDVPIPAQLLPRPQLERPIDEIIQMMLGLDGSDCAPRVSGFKPQRMRDYGKMTKKRMKEVLKTEYKYRGYSRLKGDAVRQTLEELDYQKATTAAKLAKNVKDQNTVISSKGGRDKKTSKDGKAGIFVNPEKVLKARKAMQAEKVPKFVQAGQAGNGKKAEKNSHVEKGIAASSEVKFKPNLRLDVADDGELCISRGVSNLAKVKSSEKQLKKRKRSDDSSKSQSKKQKSSRVN